MKILRILALLLAALPLYATGTLVQQPHGEHTGVTPADPSPTDAERDSRRDETAPYIRMAINAETPVQQKTEKVWAGLTAGSHTYYFEYIPGLKEVTVGTCTVGEGGDCDVITYPTTPTLAKTGCPTGFNLGWCWTGTVNVTDGQEIKVVARYTQTYMGFGENRGGESGEIVHVTNFNASGAGSWQNVLTAACNTRAAFYLVYDVAGTNVNLPVAGLKVCGRNFTVDGFTAPGRFSNFTGGIHLNPLDTSAECEVLVNGIWRGHLHNQDTTSGDDPNNAFLIQRGSSAISCDTDPDVPGSRSAKLVVANNDIREGFDDTLSTGRTIWDLTLYENHIYFSIGDSGLDLNSIIQGSVSRVTSFRNLRSRANERTPYVGFRSETNPTSPNDTQLTIEIVNDVIEIGGGAGAVIPSGMACVRGSNCNFEDVLMVGHANMTNAVDYGPQWLYVSFDVDTSTLEDDKTTNWVNNNRQVSIQEYGIYGANSHPNCKDWCASAAGAYIQNVFGYSAYARADRTRESDLRTINTRFSTPHTLPRWDLETSDLKQMGLDVVAHAGIDPGRKDTFGQTTVDNVVTEINKIELVRRGFADEALNEWGASGHLSLVGTPVFAGSSAFSTGAGDPAILYSAEDDAEIYIEAKFRKTANPSATRDLLYVRASGGTILGTLQLTTAGRLQVYDGTNTAQIAPDQIDTLANGTYYWLLLHYRKATAGSCTSSPALEGTCGYWEGAITQFWGYPIGGTTGLLTDASMVAVRPTSQSNAASVEMPAEADAATFYWDSVQVCPHGWCSEGGAGVLSEPDPPPVGGSQGPLQITGNASAQGNVTITQ